MLAHSGAPPLTTADALGAWRLDPVLLAVVTLAATGAALGHP